MLITQKRVSYFKKPIKNTVPLKELTIEEVANIIRTDHATKLATESYRASGQPEIKKEMFDVVTFGGTFTKREDASIIQQSGYICIDIDKIQSVSDIKSKIVSDQTMPPTLAFISPGGNGLKVVYHIDPEAGSRRYIYGEISNHLKNLAGVKTDPATKNLSSACFICHDSDCYYNASAPVVIMKAEPPELNVNASSIMGHAVDMDKVKKAIALLEEKRVDIVGSHEKMVNIGFSLASLGEDGRELFHRVCAIDGHYADRGRMDPKFDDFLQKSRGDVTLGSFFHACKQAGLDVKIPVAVPTLAKRLSAVEAFLSEGHQFQFNAITGRVQYKDG